MGKKKSSKKIKKSEEPKKQSKFAPFLIVGAVLGVLAMVYFVSKPEQNRTMAQMDASGPLVETRQVLSHKLFTGKAARAYQYAAEIPKVIDSQFCYCYCKKDHGHKTLLTCFTNRHGSKCDVCIEEVLYAYKLHKEGKSIEEIIVAIDKKFYRPYKPHRL